MTKSNLAFLALLLIPLLCRAYFEPSLSGERPREMNGIFFDRVKDFTKTWHLVTVRYRQDSGEQRFTYANDIAYKAMQSLKPDYPDGAMFGKVAFMTEDDPAFTSSKIPSGARRFQIMLKNKKAYPESNGWGYALFDSSGNLFNEDIKSKTQSCVACHQIVPERDYVFSRQMLLNPGDVAYDIIRDKDAEKNIPFVKVKSSELGAELKKQLKSFEYVQSLQGELQKHAFSGTLDEIIPILSQKSKVSGAPASLIINSQNFSLVVPKNKKCQSTKDGSFYQIIVFFNSKIVRNAETCL